MSTTIYEGSQNHSTFPFFIDNNLIRYQQTVLIDKLRRSGQR